MNFPRPQPAHPAPQRTRRALLVCGVAAWLPARLPAMLAALFPALHPVAARADEEPEVAAFKAYLGTRRAGAGRLKLDVPRIADNGNAVPVKIQMPGPFPAGAEVRSIHLFSEKNPVAQMAVFHFPVPVPRIEIESRVRLAGSQRLAAVATLADGSLHAATADIVVTVSACLDGS